MQVTVLGGGIIGLTTALALLDAGFRVQVVAAEIAENTTSYLAAAVWFPTHVGPPDRAATWGRVTYEKLAAQARDKVPGVVMRESLAVFREAPGGLDWTAGVGPIWPAAAEELPAGYRHGLRYAVPLVEMPVYLPWLVEQVRRRAGVLRTRRVASVSELCGPDVDAVVNCTGLAARTLVGDTSVYPVRGQIIRVTNPGLSISVRDEQHPAGRAYVHPREADCILGGTLEEGSWDTEVNARSAESILRRCRDLVPALAEAQVIEHIVGLRPGRPTVRLEDGWSDTAGVRLLHNYGHGGAGITMSWGCAAEIVDMLLGR